MAIEEQQIQNLVLNPSESLNIEIKNWLDPANASAIAKIVKAVLAIRNRNGGFLVIGFDNNSLQADTCPKNFDLFSSYHVDRIQSIISKYASENFEIAIEFLDRDEQKHPVIVVPSGVKTPVASKADLYDQNNQERNKPLIRCGDVYFRTLNSNGTPSTALARPEDWKEIVQICFDNREADFGGFFRRQLNGIDFRSLLPVLLENLQENIQSKESLQEFSSKQSLLLYDHFQDLFRNRTLSEKEEIFRDAGTWTTTLVIDPKFDNAIADKNFLNTLFSVNPNYSGWPVWFDGRSMGDQSFAPFHTNGGYESLIVLVSDFSRHLDFCRFDPQGIFYLLRALPDDVSFRINPKTLFDPIFALIQVAEVIAVGIAFAKVLGCNINSAKLGFSFSWNKLKGRRLAAWAGSGHFWGNYVAYDDEAKTYTEVPLETPVSAIGPFVEEATKNLFVKFDGFQMDKNQVEHWCRKLLERRL